MSKQTIWKITVYSLAALLLIFLFLYGSQSSNALNKYTQKPRIYIYSRLSGLGTFLSELKKIENLTNDNIRLKEENQRLLAELAGQTDIKEQNDFLRQVLELPLLKEYKLIDAGVFNDHFTPEGQFLSINKGSRDGIEKGTIVISSSGVLIGSVGEVFEDSSSITTVKNLRFKATIAVFNKKTVGIAKGTADKGIYLDFISQNDEITEGDTLTTVGNDNFPPGLIVGKITKIVSDNGSLFKEVQAKTAFEDLDISRVLILSK